MFRDVLVQGLVSHLNIDTMAYRPSVLFLNGEFWGIYNIREFYDKNYLQAHYGADKNKVVMLDKLTPENILSEGHQSELVTYKGVMVSKQHSEKDMFKINLLNMIQK